MLFYPLKATKKLTQTIKNAKIKKKKKIFQNSQNILLKRYSIKHTNNKIKTFFFFFILFFKYRHFKAQVSKIKKKQIHVKFKLN